MKRVKALSVSLVTVCLESLYKREIPDFFDILFDQYIMIRDFSYYRLYLLYHLREQGDERATDEDFINTRAESAEKEWEERRRDGLTVDQAQEMAMAVLLEGLD